MAGFTDAFRMVWGWLSGGGTVTPPDTEGIEFTVLRDRAHFTVVDEPMHFTASGRAHFTAEDD